MEVERRIYICASKLTIIGSDNGLLPGRRQAIIWTNTGILLIWTLGTTFSGILSEIHTFSFKKIHLNMSSAKWLPFCLALNVQTPRWHYGKLIMACFLRMGKHQFFPWWRHQMETFSALLAICTGNHRSPVNYPHKGHWRGALMFSLICVWINDWVNNREAGDLRRYRPHYDAIVMSLYRQNRPVAQIPQCTIL